MLVAAGLTACGSTSAPRRSGDTSNVRSLLKPGENPADQRLAGKRRGGTLTVYTAAEFEELDPGESYYVIDYAIDYATQRPLFAYTPNDASTPIPDMATVVPTTTNGGISDGGRTVTVHIRTNVHFSPPVNRAVTSADVACNATDMAGCDQTATTVPVGFGPLDLWVDQAHNQVWVENTQDTSVSIIDGAVCNGQHESACARRWPKVSVVDYPNAVAFADSTGTAYVSGWTGISVVPLRGH